MQQYSEPTHRVAAMRYNLSKASIDTPMVYIGAAPRQVLVQSTKLVTPPAPPTPATKVDSWIEYMKGQDIKHLLMLLTPEEAAFYTCDLYELLHKSFDKVTWVPELATNTLPQLRSSFEAAKASRARLLVFCSTGQVRSANAAAYWLTRARDMGLRQAVKSVIDMGTTTGTLRRCSVSALLLLLGGEQARSRYTGAFDDSVSFTPRSDTFRIPSARSEVWSMPVDGLNYNTDVGPGGDLLVITTGGTIDKDYPRSSQGYAFEFGPTPAVKALLGSNDHLGSTCFRLNRNVKYVQVSRKDSQELDDADRKQILKTCEEYSDRYKRVLCTHGTDTMIDTAKYLMHHGGDLFGDDMTFILTGAMKPALFRDSDAALNIGTALGALAVLKCGVYIAMNGNVWEWDRVMRSENGKFTHKNSIQEWDRVMRSENGKFTHKNSIQELLGEPNS